METLDHWTIKMVSCYTFMLQHPPPILRMCRTYPMMFSETWAGGSLQAMWMVLVDKALAVRPSGAAGRSLA